MHCFSIVRISIALVAVLIVTMVSGSLHASVNDNDLGNEAGIAMAEQSMDMPLPDYIADKQQEFTATMVRMNDDELSEVTGAGFSSFTIQDGVIKALFDIEVDTYTEIDSLKMGYYTKDGSAGWDEDWTDVSLGSADTDLVLKGLFIEASFTDITSSTRTLDSIKIGTPSMTGPITATFNSFSGAIYTDNGATLVLEGQRDNLGTRTITSSESEFYIQLSGSGDQAGWWFYWGNATITP